jgi:hypothetical protein
MADIDYSARRINTLDVDKTPSLASFFNVHEPRGAKLRNGKTADPKYSFCLELEPGSPVLKAIQAKIVAQAIAYANGSGDDERAFAAVAGKSAESIIAAIKENRIETPVSDGTKAADNAAAKGKKREWSRGLKIVNCRSKNPIGCGIIQNGSVVQLDGVAEIKLYLPKFFYTGVKVYAEVDIACGGPVGNDGKPWVTAYAASVLSIGKGEKLAGGGQDLKQAFSGYVGLESDEDPTGDQPADTDW